jgi:hypothetical protein
MNLPEDGTKYGSKHEADVKHSNIIGLHCNIRYADG